MPLSKISGGGWGFPTVIPQPDITSLDLSSGSINGGTAIVITGTNLKHIQSDIVAVLVKGVAATGVTYVNDTTINATTGPNSIGIGDVVLVTRTYGSRTLAAAFEYRAPTFTSIAPDNGLEAGGTPVTLTGTNFDLIEFDLNEVRFGDEVATLVVYVNATTITCVSPAAQAPGVVDLTLDTADVYPDLVLPASYTYT